ncbi:hypothetical protein P9D34_01145 [Bacillus swezeyi]|uniref:Uncharacterized protein n=1 Tax=Bacillus swezeyi TaxID=1925020 RepID=A0A1R1S1I7_9BACI|nr:hypothetical protein [Bacillus swezeyi]MEC1259065.1 hypothetical protein [Bacillus swezeyi]MED2927974.1 hypothetical protein [Bacillus swezeyi]MED2942234.1 hypothetical protein [Bacillus swezeyi]MED2965114.1 hypothetical protein [Bacillus swezeyi]MED2977781.1 hypothetical protein [Bacillus swezeyi]
MGKEILVDPDKLEGLANDFVKELTDMEKLYKDLHLELTTMILGCDPRYSHCFSGVGDAWSSGSDLVGKLDANERYIRKTADKFAEQDDILRKLYNLYDNYGTLTAMAGVSMTQFKYYGLGITKFVKDGSGLYSVKHTKLLMDLSRIIDESKYSRAARILLSPKYLFKNPNLPFADLVHKKFTKFYPQDTVDFTNKIKSFAAGMVDEAGNKAAFKDVLKAGGKFAKGNAITAALITGATETVGMGLKISENYSKYGNNREVLKRENAKAVGNAVNNTVWITGGSVAGAVIGGALGSTLGPVGTVVGGAAGSFIGGIVGEQAAKLTAGIAEKTALLLKNPIQAGLDKAKKGFELAGKGVQAFNQGIDNVNEGIRKGAETVGKGFQKAKETAGSLVNGAKNFFSGKLSFG